VIHFYKYCRGAGQGEGYVESFIFIGILDGVDIIVTVKRNLLFWADSSNVPWGNDYLSLRRVR
jgi:hypothetical protein